MPDKDDHKHQTVDNLKRPQPGEKPPSGPEVVSRYLKSLSTGPGVYRMLDEHGKAIYVGKARNLKSRVQNYARLTGHTNRIAQMILSTVSMEFVTTTTESEALLLEANLIKRLKPRYNVLLRDDKSFPYIMISHEHETPQLLKHRGAKKKKNDYFGPFASAGAVNKTINILQRAFLLRTCSDSVYHSRTRPCLLYQIKRCSAPCTGEITLSDYNRLVMEAKEFLRGESDAVRARIVELMEQASASLEFEQAGIYRDRLQALSHIHAHQDINPRNIKEADVFAIYQEGGQTCIQVFFFRTGQNWGNRAYFPKADRSIPGPEVLQSFIAQFYDNKPCPSAVLVSQQLPQSEVLAEALSKHADRRVAVLHPRRGEKRNLINHALSNAREALARRLAESSSQRRLLEALAERLQLDEPPQRIEVYDNSHIQGSHALGAMIVAGPEGFQKPHYRKFNIKSDDLKPGDDYGMMREVIRRRFRRLKRAELLSMDKEITQTNDEPSSFETQPDLLLIDGGRGQLNSVYEVLNELGLSSLQVAAVSKGPDRNAGREHIHLRDKRSFLLEPRDPVLYFIQRLRDEAHRFAIGSHRSKRKKALGSSLLDEVPGIGPTRKRALLQHFGSAKAVSRAGLADLQAVEGISRQRAKIIYDFFTRTA